MGEKPMSLSEALSGVRTRQNAKGRQPIGTETMSEVKNVRAMPSQSARWKHVVSLIGYRSENVFMCDAADLYADALEALAPAALAAGVAPRDYVRERLRELIAADRQHTPLGTSAEAREARHE